MMCHCQKCYNDWRKQLTKSKVFMKSNLTPDLTRFRYACEKCGNKRCPHHAHHIYKCTNSNEVDQPREIDKEKGA